MPGYGNSSPKEDYYDDSPDMAAKDPAADDGEKEKDTGEKTALIDSSICPGMKPGEEFTTKIEKVLEGQYLVSYPKGEAKEETDEGEAEMPESMDKGGDSEMASMMG